MARIKQVSNKSQGKAPKGGDPTENPTENPTEKAAEKAKRKYKSATNMLRAIRKEQTQTNLLLKKSPFFERARAIAANINQGEPLQWTSKALVLLLETAQQHMLERFQDANDMRIHRGKKTLTAKDMSLARKTAKLSVDSPKEFVLPKQITA